MEKTYLENNNTEIKGKVIKDDKILNRKTKRLIFYCLMIALPVIQFCLCYIYVNANSIRMAFYEYDAVNDGYVFAGLKYFKKAWAVFSTSGPWLMNSFKLYACNLVIVLGMALVFSYYIAKKYALAKFFRTILYLPHVVSSVVLTLLFKFVAGDVYTELLGDNALTGGLLYNEKSQYLTVLFYTVWLGFGTNVMLFTGTMSSIDPSIIESAQLDGVNIVQEFIHITVPMIWPTFVTFVVVGMAGIFTNQMHLYTFFGQSGGVYDQNYVFGYYMFVETRTAQGNGGFQYLDVKSRIGGFPGLSALGLIMTCILVPITLTARKLLSEFGPRTDK